MIEEKQMRLGTTILRALNECDLVLIMGSKTYGAKTGELFSTRQEMNYTLNKKKPFFLVRTIAHDDSWAEAATDVALGATKYELWLPGTPLPAGLIDKIIEKLATEPKFEAIVKEKMALLI